MGDMEFFPTKKPEWKQPSPQYQSRSILMALMSNLELLEPGLLDMPEKKKLEAIKRALLHAKELRDLCDAYLPEEW
jgi:hypothetical protein